jgi:hypothetical protein
LPFRYRYADYAFIFSVYFASAAISSRRWLAPFSPLASW